MIFRRNRPPTAAQISKAVVGANYNHTREVPVTKWCPDECCDRTGLMLRGSPIAWRPPRHERWRLELCPVCQLPTVWRREK